ncbi:MAG TPA: hypothetical protein VEQ58_00790 [Polyangiaceae bacterium]|nr:hypothetical protein [Polyangiaceae bacterium]
MRRSALLGFMICAALAAGCPRSASAACSRSSPCIDAEPLWLTPSAGRLTLVSDTAPLPLGKLGGSITATLRFRPVVLNVPAPNRNGRDVNVLSHATDLALAGRLGIGNRLELTLVLPAGLYQGGSGIKGVTAQSADAITHTTLHDPRLGFAYALPWSRPALSAKLRFEAKLPLGNAEALSGEQSAVASPSFALSSRFGGFFAGAELGARLRRPSPFFGVRVGSQAAIACGVGYELPNPRLALSLELYLLPSLIDSGVARYLPAEWLGSARWTPRHSSGFSIGFGAGSGLPLSGDSGGSSFGVGVPSYRALLFARYAPRDD